MKTLRVATTRAYDVLIDYGCFLNVGQYVIDAISDRAKIVCIVTDKNVDRLYGDIVEASVKSTGMKTFRYVIEPGEGSKTMAALEKLLEYLSDCRLTRSDALVALGGGVVGDLTGFAAATYQRGIDYVQVPTTLMAAVDSAVGGKVGVNSKGAKNMFGAFWQPRRVVCDCNTFKTLAKEDYLDGIAEAIKNAMVADEDIFDVVARKRLNDDDIVYRCAGIKCRIVSDDEFDRNTRQLLNFGHTTGHAIEQLSGYTISHGRAVATGMSMATRAAFRYGFTNESTSRELDAALIGLGFDVSCPYTEDELLGAALSDKKRSGDKINLIMPAKIGKCFSVQIKTDDLMDFFEKGLEPLPPENL